MEVLTDEIEGVATQLKIGFHRLSKKEAEKQIRELGSLYSLNTEKLYLWEQKGVNRQVVSYDEDWSYVIGSILKDFEENIILVVTDDNFKPWPSFQIRRDDLIALIEELRYFEYFIINKSYKSIVFDTHHNKLIKMSLG